MYFAVIKWLLFSIHIMNILCVYRRQSRDTSSLFLHPLCILLLFFDNTNLAQRPSYPWCFQWQDTRRHGFMEVKFRDGSGTQRMGNKVFKFTIRWLRRRWREIHYLVHCCTNHDSEEFSLKTHLVAVTRSYHVRCFITSVWYVIQAIRYFLMVDRLTWLHGSQ